MLLVMLLVRTFVVVILWWMLVVVLDIKVVIFVEFLIVVRIQVRPIHN